MPTTIRVINRYNFQGVALAAVTFDNAVPTANTKQRTNIHGWLTVSTEGLGEGPHVMHIIPEHTSTEEVGPAIAENGGTPPRRIFRSLNINIVVRKQGKESRVESASVSANQEPNGAVEMGNNPQILVKLQPVFYRSGNYNPRPSPVSMILIHHTSRTANIGGTLNVVDTEQGNTGGSPHYIVSSGGVGLMAPPERAPRIVKTVPHSGAAWHADQSWWDGLSNINNHSIGIEQSHQAGKEWPAAQIDVLIGLLERLLNDNPAILPRRVVGHSDVKTAGGVLTGRDCPGLEFDWTRLEARGIGLLPRPGAVSLDLAYGGFFRVQPNGQLGQWSKNIKGKTVTVNDRDDQRIWGGTSWAGSPAAVAASVAGGVAQILGHGARNVTEAAVATVVQGGQSPATVIATPIRELQTDLRAIGYSVEVNGQFDNRTRMAVQMFQQHFFAGSRRGLITSAQRGKVGRVTAEYIKRVRP